MGENPRLDKAYVRDVELSLDERQQADACRELLEGGKRVGSLAGSVIKHMTLHAGALQGVESLCRIRDAEILKCHRYLREASQKRYACVAERYFAVHKLCCNAVHGPCQDR